MLTRPSNFAYADCIFTGEIGNLDSPPVSPCEQTTCGFFNGDEPKVLQHHRNAKVFIDEPASSKLQLADYYRWGYGGKPEWQQDA